ncbi:hypothetical protein GUITHDRAFT_141838 [Guillardia theta CCMP2712]|uniref:Right handed beta helix domain-containing protein n=1 Tax=Guillardia theta (strain CCMP2712) TaxID=905079 RepID=L1IZA5_GUITC|nr:hypothetical protein GUITHDRAFT_141838 [Guillardia theta CCMP2712]EKX41576.1 hypothetical protein GUITHDRAFT_141838 [Guillardia theta CCMP2712]|eukprot:XP_005828556.1 hypothetical protein GUITHDRAFT_141838 [Guillardia theta CCMP2712]
MVKNLRSAALIVAIYGALHVAGIHTADTQLRRTSLTGTASPPSKGAHAYTSLEPLVFSSLARGLWTLYWLFEHLIAEISSAVTWPFLSYRRFKEKMQSDSSPEPPPWEDFEYPVESLNDDHVVPSWKYESMKDAIEQARSGQRIYARKGDHHWDAKITLQGPHDTRGKIRWMHVVLPTGSLRWSISINTGGRCAGAYAMMCAKSSRVTVRRCGVGGMGGGARRAVCCVMIMDSSWCCLQNSQIDETEYQSPGIRLIENGKAVIESCVFQRNGYGIAVDNNAKVKVRGCILKENNHAAFYAGWDASNSEIDIRQCAVYGRVWHSSDRPGKLSECDNRFTVSSMTQSSMIVDPELAADAVGTLCILSHV